MPDQIESFKVLCDGGLDTSQNHLTLSQNKPGSATRLVNYEVSLFGGYRRIEGFSKYDNLYSEVGSHATNALTAEGKVLGLAIYTDLATNTEIIIAARKDIGANTYSFYRFVANTGWVKYTTGLTLSTTSSGRTIQKLRHVAFNFGQGQGNEIVFVDGINNAIAFDGTNWRFINPGSSGTNIDPGGAQALNAPSLVDVFENTLFIGGDITAPTQVAHSTPNQSYNWTTSGGGSAGRLSLGLNVVNFKPFRDNLFIFAKNSIKKANLQTVSAGGSSVTTFVLEPVTSNVGCVATDSILEIGGDLVFLAPDGVRPVAGTSRIGDVELETISKSIQSLLSVLGDTHDLNTLNGVVIRSKSQFRYFFGDSSFAAENSVGIVGGLRTADQRLGWEFGELLGIRASCCTSGYIGTTEFVLHGDYDGHLYRQEQGTDFNGANIISIYRTPYLDFGDTETRKVFRKINAFIRAEGPLTIGLAFDYDWGDINAPQPASYETSSIGAPVTYAGTNILYNGTNIIYGGTDKPIFSTDVQGSGYSARATFVSEGSFSPHSIQGLVYEFSVAGRS